MMKARTWLVAALALVVTLPAAADEKEESPVKVEWVKPKRPKKPTLRFLKQQVDFLRSQLDHLREVPRNRDGDALVLDERWLRYREMMASAQASRDSVEAARLAQERLHFLESVADLAALETRLDEMNDLLTEQEARLAWLDEDFTGRQETAIVVLVSAMPGGERPTGFRFVDEEGTARQISVLPGDAQTIDSGGAIQLLHEFVEPREQVWEVSVQGANWTSDIPVYVTFQPQRNRLSFLELDLAQLATETGAVGLEARLWVHGDRVNTDDWRWASR